MKVTRKSAMELQCWQCLGEYADGKQDCENVRCPLYSFMPYAQLEPDLSIFQYHPRHKGRVLVEDTKKELTDEERKALSERLRKTLKRS